MDTVDSFCHSHGFTDQVVNKWLFMALTSMTTMLEFGLVFSFGAVFVELLDTFKQDRSTTAAVQSLLLGVTLSFGVISGSLITKLGLHVVTLISSILAPLGFCLSFFVTDIKYLYVSIGIVSGTGISMSHISSLVVIGRIFTGTQRLLCITIHIAFQAAMGLVYPYLLDWLNGLYGLSGTFLILGGICCNSYALCVLCWVNRTSINAVSPHLEHVTVNEVVETTAVNPHPEQVTVIEVVETTAVNPHPEQVTVSEVVETTAVNPHPEQVTVIEVVETTAVNPHPEQVTVIEVVETTAVNPHPELVTVSEVVEMTAVNPHPEQVTVSEVVETTAVSPHLELVTVSEVVETTAVNPHPEQVTVSEVVKTTAVNPHPELVTVSEVVETTDVDKCDDPSQIQGVHMRKIIMKHLHSMRELMTKPYVFLLLGTGAAIASLNAYIGLMLDMSVWKGFTYSQGLLSFVFYNIFNCLSRLIPGILTQRKGVNSYIYPIASTFCGCIGYLLFYVPASYTVFAVANCMLWIATGGYLSSSVILVVKIVKSEQIPVATGLLFTVIGLLSAGLGPIFGRLRDISGSYGSVFLAMSAMQVIAAIFYSVSLLYQRNGNIRTTVLFNTASQQSNTPKKTLIFTITRNIDISQKNRASSTVDV